MAAPGAITPEMLAGPAMLPPTGVIPNLVDPWSAGPILIAVGGVLVAIMGGMVINRITTKVLVTGSWAWDDLTCVIGALLTGAYYGMSVVGVQQAKYGTHQWDVTLATYISDTTATVEYLSETLAPITLLFVKITFFILFLQLFKPARTLRYAILGGLIFTALFYLVTFILAFVSATPRPGETLLSHEEFNPIINIEISAAIWLPTVGLVIDLYILVLPLYCVSTLHLPTKRKVMVGSVFLTGILAVVASILSLVYRIAIYRAPLDDLTFHQVQVLITSVVEMTLGVIVSCMPALSRMLRHLQPGWSQLRSRFSSRYASTAASRGTYASRDGYVSKGMSGSTPLSHGGSTFGVAKPGMGYQGYERTSSDDGAEDVQLRNMQSAGCAHTSPP